MKAIIVFLLISFLLIGLRCGYVHGEAKGRMNGIIEHGTEGL